MTKYEYHVHMQDGNDFKLFADGHEVCSETGLARFYVVWYLFWCIPMKRTVGLLYQQDVIQVLSFEI